MAKIQAMLNMDPTYLDRLRSESNRLTEIERRRVSMKEIVQKALEDYFKRQGIEGK